MNARQMIIRTIITLMPPACGSDYVQDRNNQDKSNAASVDGRGEVDQKLVGTGLKLVQDPSIVEIEIFNLTNAFARCTGVIMNRSTILTTGTCVAMATKDSASVALGIIHFANRRQIGFTATQPKCKSSDRRPLVDVTYNPSYLACKSQGTLSSKNFGTRHDTALIHINGSIDNPVLATAPKPVSAGLSENTEFFTKGQIVTRKGFSGIGLVSSRAKVTKVKSIVTTNGNLSAEEISGACFSSQGGGIFDDNGKLVGMSLHTSAIPVCNLLNSRDYYLSIPAALAAEKKSNENFLTRVMDETFSK